MFKKILLACVLSIGVACAYSDTDKVYRAGTCTEALFANGSGVTIDKNGKLAGVSVSVQTNFVTVEQATASFPNKKVGVTTIGAIKKAGGTVVASPTANNTYHALLSGITAATAEGLFKPFVFANPNMQCKK